MHFTMLPLIYVIIIDGVWQLLQINKVYELH